MHSLLSLWSRLLEYPATYDYSEGLFGLGKSEGSFVRA